MIDRIDDWITSASTEPKSFARCVIVVIASVAALFGIIYTMLWVGESHPGIILGILLGAIIRFLVWALRD